MSIGPCAVPGCTKSGRAAGMCGAHYRRKRLGQPLDAPVRGRALEDWISKDQETGCWNWAGRLTANGYARRGHSYVHRIAYEKWVGPIPEGFQIDHLCRNRACCNPDHLEAVTQRENIHRGEAPAIVTLRTGVCARGHEFTPENTYTRPSGGRTCNPCRRLMASARAAMNGATE